MYDVMDNIRAFGHIEPILEDCDIENTALVTGEINLKHCIFKGNSIIRGDDITHEEGEFAIIGEHVIFEDAAIVHYHNHFNGKADNPVIIGGLAHGATYEEGAENYGIEFKCTKVGKRSVICGTIIGVNIPENKFVPYGTVVYTQEEANCLQNISDVTQNVISENKIMAKEWLNKRKEIRNNASSIKNLLKLRNETFVEPSAKVEYSEDNNLTLLIGEQTHISVDVYLKGGQITIGNKVNLQDGVVMIAPHIEVQDSWSVPHLVFLDADEYIKLKSNNDQCGFMGIGRIKGKSITVGSGVVFGVGYDINDKDNDIHIPPFAYIPNGFKGGMKEINELIKKQEGELNLRQGEMFSSIKNCIPENMRSFAKHVREDNIFMAKTNSDIFYKKSE